MRAVRWELGHSTQQELPCLGQTGSGSKPFWPHGNGGSLQAGYPPSPPEGKEEFTSPAGIMYTNGVRSHSFVNPLSGERVDARRHNSRK